MFAVVSMAAVGEVLAKLPPPDTAAHRSVILVFQDDAPAYKPARGKPRAEQRKALVTSLKAVAKARQKPLLNRLQQLRGLGKATGIRPLWLINGITVTASADTIAGIQKAFPDVVVAEDLPIHIPVNPLDGGIISGATPDGWHVDQLRAADVWADGYEGQGTLVAMLDSGVDPFHQDIEHARFIGHEEGWCNTSGYTGGEGPACEGTDLTPNDIGSDTVSGHGTGVAGLIIGGDTTGAPVGVSPKASWMMARIFDASGDSSLGTALAGLQWIVGLPTSPDVINISWEVAQVNPGNTCNNPTFNALKQAMTNLRNSGIFLVASSGNNHVAVLPAAYPEVFAVGAVNSSGYLWDFSGKGVTTCVGRGLLPGERPYPNAVAPGDGVITTDFSNNGLLAAYNSVSGTSFSAPQVSAAAALLLSAYPNLTMDELEIALSYPAVAGGGQTGVDFEYGYGIVDAKASFDYLLATHLPRPPEVSIHAPTGGGLSLTWEDVPNGGNGVVYNVIRDGGIIASGVSGNTYLDADGDPAGAHTYQVIAVDASNVARVSAPTSALFGNVNSRALITEQRVDAFDLVSITRKLNTNTGSVDWDPEYDLNGDGQVDDDDVNLLITRIADPMVTP
ncbi:MAG: S8 family serine peptidase [Leptospirillia bacterium]